MSYMNQHMSNPVNGIRTNVAVQNIYEVLRGTTWENFKDRHVSDQEYGNTLHGDLPVAAYTFKHRFNLTAAALDLGYSNSSPGGAATNISKRLKRMNVLYVIDVARGLLYHDLITREDIRHFLTDPVFPPAGLGRGKRPWQGIVYKWYAKELVKSAVSKCGSQQAVVDRLGVKLEVITYWMELDVVDPMVRHIQK